MKTITFMCLVNMQNHALWAMDFWELQHIAYSTKGAELEYNRYKSILNRIEAAMRNY